MVDFKTVELEDKPLMDYVVMSEDTSSADFNFGNVFIWDKKFKQKLAHLGSRVAVKPEYLDFPFFSFPIGTGDIESIILELHEHSEQAGFPFVMRGCTKDHVELLEEHFPGKFSITPERKHFDYIYSAERLASLSGKKLHSKRNHINRFIENNDWTFERMTADQGAECLEFLDDWTASLGRECDPELMAEHVAIERGIEHFDYLGFEGGILRVDGKMAGFTMGEKISSNTFDVHFEKADHSIQGSYPIINREFVRQVMDIHPEIELINREDDTGEENLRKAKLSYYPDFLLEKHVAVWTGD